jgi:hypothetical protein
MWRLRACIRLWIKEIHMTKIKNRKLGRAVAGMAGATVLALSSVALPGTAEASLLQPGRTATARTSDVIATCTATVEKRQGNLLQMHVKADARPATLGGYLTHASTQVGCYLTDTSRNLVYRQVVVRSGATASFAERFLTDKTELAVCVEATVIKKDSSVVLADACTA